jgi:hypothetical protein
MLLTELIVEPQLYNDRIHLGQGLYETRIKLLDNHITLTLKGCDNDCYEYLKSLIGSNLAIVEVPHDL